MNLKNRWFWVAAIFLTLAVSAVWCIIILVSVLLFRPHHKAESGFKDFPEALRSAPEIPTLPEVDANSLAQQSFVTDYNNWIDCCRDWGIKCKGTPVALLAEFKNAEFKTDSDGDHVLLSFNAESPSQQISRVLVEIARKPSEANIAYWSKIHAGATFRLSGTIDFACLFGPSISKVENWRDYLAKADRGILGKPLLIFWVRDADIEVVDLKTDTAR